MRAVLLVLVTLFRDPPVQLGPLLGGALGWWGAEYVFSDPPTAAVAFAVLGWGVGAYIGYHRSNALPRRKRPKLKVYQGGK